jgi:hypothetical protein
LERWKVRVPGSSMKDAIAQELYPVSSALLIFARKGYD